VFDFKEMLKVLPDFKRQAIKARLEESVPHLGISEEVNVSVQTVKNYSSNLHRHGTPLLPSITAHGHPRAMTTEIVEVWFSGL
jgi:hypothetical protein